MTAPSLLETLSVPGATQVLADLVDGLESAFFRPQLEDRFLERGVEDPSVLVDQFMEHRLIEPIGTRLQVSRIGAQTTLLIEALHGADIEETIRKLRRLSNLAEQYELVREGMTSHFFESLLYRPGFAQLYICSPWINPSKRDAAILRYVIMQQQSSESGAPGIQVISRPPESMPQGARQGIDPFMELGAEIYYNRRLHSKLYIREPGPSGGITMAIVGSENLTRSDHLELGIRITDDGRLVNKLIVYFLSIASRSQEQTRKI